VDDEDPDEGFNDNFDTGVRLLAQIFASGPVTMKASAEQR
jgi:hypothetical protein